MAINVPRCPQCGDCKVCLAPIPPTWDYLKHTCGELPVACMQCQWHGVWKDVIYVSL